MMGGMAINRGVDTAEVRAFVVCVWKGGCCRGLVGLVGG